MSHTSQEILDYLMSTYDKHSLAAMVASAVQDGILPGIPTHLGGMAQGSPGRPTAALTQARKDKLIEVLVEHYPKALNLYVLLQQTGMRRETLLRLQEDHRFMLTLPNHLRIYFQSMGWQWTKMHPILRGMLDLHNYLIMHQHPTVHLPMYDVHRALWGIKDPKGDMARRTQIYDSRERSRVREVSFVKLIERAGWDAVPPSLEPYDEQEISPETFPCMIGCRFAHGALSGTVDIQDVVAMRELLLSDCSLDPMIVFHLPPLQGYIDLHSTVSETVAIMLGVDHAH